MISPRSSEQNVADVIDAAEQKDGIEALPFPGALPFPLDAGERETIHTAIDKKKPVVVAVCHIFYISGSKVIFCKTVVAVGDTIAQK